MIWAFNEFSGNSVPSTDDGMKYHGLNKDNWTLQINSDNTVISGGSNGLPEFQITKVLELSNGSYLSAGLDSTNQKIVFQAHVLAGSYLAIGFNNSMTNTDMISWEAGSTAAASGC